MSLLKRFAFYFGGFTIGLILLYFFVGGSGASCEFDYGPNSRTLKNIRIKERIFTNKASEELKKYQLDTATISFALKNGTVLFSESNTKLDSCNIYKIESVIDNKSNKDDKILLTIENIELKK
jgi:hypothetical protein